MSDTALLVLDMVNRFDFEGGDRLAKAARAIVPRIETLRARFDAAGAPTIYVNDNFSHWQGQFGDLVAACRDAGGASASIVQRLAPRPFSWPWRCRWARPCRWASRALPTGCCCR